MSFNPRLHGMRALAAFGVLLFHWAQLFPVQNHLYPGATPFGLQWHASFFIGFGWMGVPLFFVLSGYLLTHILNTQPITPRRSLKFWQRRFLRIYPAVWLQVAIFVALGPMIAGLPTLSFNSAGITNALLYINLPPTMSRPINPVWWTLPIELGFYLLLPLIILLCQRIHWAWVVTTGVLGTLIWRWASISLLADPPYYKHLAVLDALPGVLTPFLTGVAIAHLPMLARTWRYIVLAGAFIAIYALLLGIHYNLDSYWQGGFMLVAWPSLLAIAIAGAVWAAHAPLYGLTWLGSQPLVWLGHLSFGIYLWHYPCFKVARALLPASDSLLDSVYYLSIVTTATVLLASASYYIIERPLMGWGRRNHLKAPNTL
ncbi:acyltransferase [Gilvimarinus sp. SDUM040013]|uniref:Acyltransferase n=1 Tax=Gilvimarinus gilvus TaxID=3058038 RepID=A0ABU4RWI3_9GAMM|nr:acyltransferase [Gilvimarinus sp. SDUM040013]MDO3385254.1 acyltransferase [Gilvimarinus sp. SDUM040013]MDX6849237.1 acyltransferase [Gilvimarinus sp. SDUM040013]